MRVGVVTFFYQAVKIVRKQVVGVVSENLGEKGLILG